MADSIEALSTLLASEVVFIRLKDDLPIGRRTEGKTLEFLLPAKTPLPLTHAGVKALEEDNRVFPLPAMVQGLLHVLEREELLGKDFAPLPLYRTFTRSMAAEVVDAAANELKRAMEDRNWALAQPRAAFLLNVSEDSRSQTQARVWTSMGTAACRLGRLEKGAEWLSTAVQLDPKLFEAQAELGSCLARLGRLAEAKTALLAARALKQDLAVCYNLAQVCRQLGDIADARTHIAEAEKLEPQNSRVAALKNQLG